MDLEVIARAVAALLAAWAAAHPHVPVTPTDDRQLDAGLATAGGVAAWWGPGGAEPGFHLRIWRGDGRIDALSPRFSPAAPTVDVGRGPTGALWITYARCTGAVATCRAYAYSLRDRREHDLGLGQAVAVAVDGDRVAWFREARDYGPSQLLVGSLADRGATARPVTLTKIWGAPVGRPAALDLAGGHLAYAAYESGDEIRTLRLRAGTPAAMRDVAEASFGEECTFVVASPTITRTGLTWLSSTLGSRSSCRPRVDTLVRRRWADGAMSYATVRAPAAKDAVVVAGRVLALAPHRSDHDQGDRDACVPDLLLHDEGVHAAGCEARLLPPPRWRRRHG